MEAKNRYSNKTPKELIPIAVRYFHKYIKLRDSENGHFKCISCGQIKPIDQFNAGHYMASTYSATRFDPLNVSGQCIACNCHKHGNLIFYRKGLIEKIGLAEVEKLEMIARMRHKWDRYTLIDIIQTYKAKCKELE